jgi:hypothetical protein
MAVIGCPEKDPPWHPGEGFVLKAIGGGESMSAKEYPSWTKAAALQGTEWDTRRPLPTGLAIPRVPPDHLCLKRQLIYIWSYVPDSHSQGWTRNRQI